jgi:beta-galactosidase
MTLGRDNPTRASSEASGHGARLANDGNPETFWQAESSDPNAWLRIDLERVVSISRTKLVFPTPGDWRYKIEISDTGDSWKLLTDQMKSVSDNAQRTDMIPTGSASGRFIRVSVAALPSGQPAALAEVVVFATQGTQ